MSASLGDPDCWSWKAMISRDASNEVHASFSQPPRFKDSTAKTRHSRSKSWCEISGSREMSQRHKTNPQRSWHRPLRLDIGCDHFNLDAWRSRKSSRLKVIEEELTRAKIHENSTIYIYIFIFIFIFMVKQSLKTSFKTSKTSSKTSKISSKTSKTSLQSLSRASRRTLELVTKRTH